MTYNGEAKLKSERETYVILLARVCTSIQVCGRLYELHKHLRYMGCMAALYPSSELLLAWRCPRAVYTASVE